ncbi:ribonuclease H-like domain-containing protein [Tanacetum coccineum]
MKAKSTLLLAIPNDHLLKFHGIKDVKTLWEPIKARCMKLRLKANQAQINSQNVDPLYLQIILAVLMMQLILLMCSAARSKDQASPQPMPIKMTGDHADHKGEEILKKIEESEFNGKDRHLTLTSNTSQMNENELHDCHLDKSEEFESASDSSVNEIEDENNQVNDSKTISSVPIIESTASKSSKDSLEQPKDVRPSAPIIKEWRVDRDDDCVGNPQYALQDQGIFDSGCSKHMIRIKTYLTDYQDIDGGFVAFSGSTKGGGVDLFASKLLKMTILVLLVRRESNTKLLVRPSLCDNGTEFKNNDMNQFCGMKGIKREFSVARTPQQNGVAERKNKTLIEAARTMLEDSLLPTTFWTEAVNTACYVQNRVLVTKPHNKTPYELLLGRPPNETVYKEWEDKMERAATTASSLEVEQESGNINRTQSMATLNEPSP